MSTPAFEATVGNLAETYAALARATPGCRLDSVEGGWIATGQFSHPICNYAFVAQPTRELLMRAAAESIARPVFNAYWPVVSGGDEPSAPGLDNVLQLAIMASADESGTLGPTCEIVPIGTEDRFRVASFMAEQFFGRYREAYRTTIARATAQAEGLDLYAVPSPNPRPNRELDAALLLSRRQGAIGLYNLCVRRDLRGRGLGRDCVRAALALCRGADLSCVLQCEAGLVPFYEREGFVGIGTLHVLSSKRQPLLGAGP